MPPMLVRFEYDAWVENQSNDGAQLRYVRVRLSLSRYFPLIKAAEVTGEALPTEGSFL